MPTKGREEKKDLVAKRRKREEKKRWTRGKQAPVVFLFSISSEVMRRDLRDELGGQRSNGEKKARKKERNAIMLVSN